MNRLRHSLVTLALAALVASTAGAQSPQQFDEDATRYLALGDSIASGYKAMPVTEGYAYRLYSSGAFDRLPHTLFCNAAVPGATSADVLNHQVPQALIPYQTGGFNPKYITLSVGGNDLLSVLYYAMDPRHSEADILAFAQRVITEYGQNLAAVLGTLRAALPAVKIFVANQYPLPEIEGRLSFAAAVIATFNQVTAQVVAGVYAQAGNVYLVDVHTAFLGKNNLVEGGRGNVSFLEVHPTNVGHRVIEKAFSEVIGVHK